MASVSHVDVGKKGKKMELRSVATLRGKSHPEAHVWCYSTLLQDAACKYDCSHQPL